MADTEAKVSEIRAGGERGRPQVSPIPVPVHQKTKVYSFVLGAAAAAGLAQKQPLPPTLPHSLEMAGEITETGELYSPYVSFPL